MIGLFIGLLGFWLLAVRRRSRSPHSQFLERSLTEHGFLFLSSIVPPFGVTGPFPQGRGYDANGGFMLTSSWQYRHVTFRDRQGNQHEAWARLFFTGSERPQIDWEPDLGEIKKAEQPPATLKPARMNRDIQNK